MAFALEFSQIVYAIVLLISGSVCVLVYRYRGINHCTPFFTNLCLAFEHCWVFCITLVNRYTRTEPWIGWKARPRTLYWMRTNTILFSHRNLKSAFFFNLNCWSQMTRHNRTIDALTQILNRKTQFSFKDNKLSCFTIAI